MLDKSRPIDLFSRLQIESQSVCNRDCWFCPRTFDTTGNYLGPNGEQVNRQMPTDRIIDLLDQAQALGFNGLVGFHHYSEPLLDKRIVDLAEAARERGMRPYIHTNGDALKSNEALCRSVQRAFDKIVVGLYDHQSDEESEQHKRDWKNRLPDANLHFSVIGPLGASAGYSMGIPRALVPSDSRVSVPDLAFTNAPCNRPLLRMIIRYNGDMAQCCEDTYSAFRLGNVEHQSLKELWFSSRHVESVQHLLRGDRNRYELCKKCPMSPTGAPVEGLKIGMRRRQIEMHAVE
ncbi:MAG: radical SAM protein with 4Fe4S-binding SPASM domain [Halioglobus sp.]|jgi:radical SAM protein with 4Fe4S-binding SPASM domain